MNWIDYLIIAVICGVLGLAGLYVYRARKSGKKCIGCPHSSQCAGSCRDCHK